MNAHFLQRTGILAALLAPLLLILEPPFLDRPTPVVSALALIALLLALGLAAVMLVSQGTRAVAAGSLDIGRRWHLDGTPGRMAGAVIVALGVAIVGLMLVWLGR